MARELPGKDVCPRCLRRAEWRPLLAGEECPPWSAPAACSECGEAVRRCDRLYYTPEERAALPPRPPGKPKPA